MAQEDRFPWFAAENVYISELHATSARLPCSVLCTTTTLPAGIQELRHPSILHVRHSLPSFNPKVKFGLESYELMSVLIMKFKADSQGGD